MMIYSAYYTMETKAAPNILRKFGDFALVSFLTVRVHIHLSGKRSTTTCQA